MAGQPFSQVIIKKDLFPTTLILIFWINPANMHLPLLMTFSYKQQHLTHQLLFQTMCQFCFRLFYHIDSHYFCTFIVFLIKGLNRDVAWFSITDDEWTQINETREIV
jgi:hypothetical protein